MSWAMVKLKAGLVLGRIPDVDRCRRDRCPRYVQTGKAPASKVDGQASDNRGREPLIRSNKSVTAALTNRSLDDFVWHRAVDYDVAAIHGQRGGSGRNIEYQGEWEGYPDELTWLGASRPPRGLLGAFDEYRWRHKASEWEWYER